MDKEQIVALEADQAVQVLPVSPYISMFQSRGEFSC